MEDLKEKFTIKMKDDGVDIIGGDAKSLYFTASEALMLLDILRNEEQKLKQMAEEASPIPIKIHV
jgi:hypothetical protein